MSGLTAPIGGGNERLDVELIPAGMHVCTLFGLVDIGTQDSGQFGLKHKVRLSFEFPQHMRVFFEGSDPQPACIFNTETLSMHEKGNLRKSFVQPMINRILSDQEAEKFDISSLLGKHFVATIVHSSDGKWANIQSITPLNNQNMLMFGLQQPSLAQINPTQFFTLSQGFESDNFAQIKGKARDLIINSVEGKAHAMKGGKFAEQANDNNTSNTSTATAPPPSSNGMPADIVMIDKNTSFQAYIGAGWSVEQLIEHGKAKRVVAQAPPAPLDNVQAPPMPPAPPVAVAPTEPEKPKLIFKDPGAQPLEKWLEGGWTVEMIVQQGHAVFQ